MLICQCESVNNKKTDAAEDDQEILIENIKFCEPLYAIRRNTWQ